MIDQKYMEEEVLKYNAVGGYIMLCHIPYSAVVATTRLRHYAADLPQIVQIICCGSNEIVTVQYAVDPHNMPRGRHMMLGWLPW